MRRWLQTMHLYVDLMLHSFFVVAISFLALYLPSLGLSPPNGLGTVPSPMGGDIPPGPLSILFSVGTILGLPRISPHHSRAPSTDSDSLLTEFSCVAEWTGELAGGVALGGWIFRFF